MKIKRFEWIYALFHNIQKELQINDFSRLQTIFYIHPIRLLFPPHLRIHFQQ